MKWLLRILFGAPAKNPNPLNQPTIPLDEQGFIACKDAQPPFDTPVLVRIHFRSEPIRPDECARAPVGWRCTRDHGHDGPCAAVPAYSPMIGIGRRTREINAAHGQEQWHCAHLHSSSSGAITHWKPL